MLIFVSREGLFIFSLILFKFMNWKVNICDFAVTGQSVPILRHAQTRSIRAHLENKMNTPSKYYHTYKQIKTVTNNPWWET